MVRSKYFLMLFTILLASCTPAPSSSLPEVTMAATLIPSSTPVPPTAVPTETVLIPTITPTVQVTEVPEWVLIKTPKQNDTISDPVIISGTVDTTSDQTVYIRMVDLDMLELGTTNTILQTSQTQPVPFEIQVEYIPGEAQDALLQVYQLNPSGGSLLHLNSRMVKLSPSDPPKNTEQSSTETMQIDSLRIIQNNNKLELQADGFAGNLFENSLSYKLCGDGGTGSADLVCGTVDNIMLQGVTTIQTKEVGGTGAFSIRTQLQNGQWKQAYLVIYSVSMANGEVTHAASMMIKNGP